MRLPEDVANQIAAGEVVERPASVVKELLENAIDAEARRLQIEVDAGGRERIRVTDDGIGMTEEDARLCLERHATSKIRSANDLTTVRTLGFRGEAVPSIASVSRFTLITRPRGADAATQIEVEGGKLVDVRAAGAAEGTSIEVRDLFFNVPARKKFLKRDATEMSHIHDAVVRLALARRDLAFTLRSGDRTVLDIPPESPTDPFGRLSRVLGKGVGRHLFAIPDDGEDWAVKVRGFVSSPELTERTTRGLHVYVNGRFVRDRTIQHAIQDAYRTLMERGRHPVVVLYVELDPEHFDVNVHPQKTEVRFERTGDIHRAVTGTLRRTLAAQPWLERGGYSPPTAPPMVREAPPPSYRGPSPVATANHGDRLLRAFDTARKNRGEVQLPSIADSFSFSPEPVTPGVRFAELEPVGQVLGTYLVCQGPGRMVLIDQHAAHERIAFEKMRQQRREAKVAVQPLLVPLSLELDAGRAAVAEAECGRLTELGLDLEHFGGTTWMVKSCPAALGQAKLESLVLDLLDELKAVDQTTPYEERIDALLSCAACHTVVRAGDRLENAEIKSLLEQMDRIDFGAHCPHGRPVFVEYPEATLARMFHRS